MTDVSTPDVTLTASAAKRITAILAKQGGSEIDFTNELIGAAFKINNPNATSGCGCGTSFSV